VFLIPLLLFVAFGVGASIPLWIPPLAYARIEKRTRPAWAGLPGPTLAGGVGPYRAGELPGAPLRRAPLVVRAAAMIGFYWVCDAVVGNRRGVGAGGGDPLARGRRPRCCDRGRACGSTAAPTPSARRCHGPSRCRRGGRPRRAPCRRDRGAAGKRRDRAGARLRAPGDRACGAAVDSRGKAPGTSPASAPVAARRDSPRSRLDIPRTWPQNLS